MAMVIDLLVAMTSVLGHEILYAWIVSGQRFTLTTILY